MGRTERVISILGISAVVICTGATAAYMYKRAEWKQSGK